MITGDLTNCDSLVALSDVYNEWGGSFDNIHAAAALNKYAKLSRGRGADTQLLPRLLQCWLQQLPLAGEQACANVLWALGKMSAELDEVWTPTFEAYLRLVQQNMSGSARSPQEPANVTWACARLGKGPAPGQLAVLMQAVLLPKVLAAAQPQALANIVWALGKLSTAETWQGGVDEGDIQQLLGSSSCSCCQQQAQYKQSPMCWWASQT